MEDIIKKISEVQYLSEIDNINNIDSNLLLLAIIKTEKYELLNNSNIKIHIDDSKSFNELINELLGYSNAMYYLRKSGFVFSKEEINSIFNKILKMSSNKYIIDNFFGSMFENKDDADNFILEHNEEMRNVINNKDDIYISELKELPAFIQLYLEEKPKELIGNLKNYSVLNLKKLVENINDECSYPYYAGTNDFANYLFSIKDEFEPHEFLTLLKILKERRSYNSTYHLLTFDQLINNNLDYLINIVSETDVKEMPKCLAESKEFRNECIKRNRIDLATRCVLPEDIFQNEELIIKYCNELNIDIKDFYEREKIIIDYYKKNNNIFNTLLATTLKDEIFNLGDEHVEKFINDIDTQLDISKLNDKELKLLYEVLKRYNYEEYDVSNMITNIIKNISSYSELVDSIDISLLKEAELKNIIKVMQNKSNKYQITNINDLDKYYEKKCNYFVSNYNNNINNNKENLLKVLFNIDLYEGKYINKYYCYDRLNNMLDKLSHSELPKNVLEYLTIINKIIETKNGEDIIAIYNNYKNSDIYSSEIPLDTFLRSTYSKMYSDSLYKLEEKENIYGPKDAIYKTTKYNDSNINICIPREKFNFLIHCVGSCSLATDVIDDNYKIDWADRPQIQDHYVACSYINQNEINSVRTNRGIIYGFDSLEGGSLIGMGNCDIDSAGYPARSYDSSKELMKANGDRASYYVPSILMNNDESHGYNEIVIERRNYNHNKDNTFKRMPDYIIMISDSLDESNFISFDELKNNKLSFLSEDDAKQLLDSNGETEVKTVLNKYINDREKISNYTSLIMKSIKYEDSLKAASEFDIPLIIIDKEYYFRKAVNESLYYNEETKKLIIEKYLTSNDYDKRVLFARVTYNKDVSDLLKEKEKTDFIIQMI